MTFCNFYSLIFNFRFALLILLLLTNSVYEVSARSTDGYAPWVGEDLRGVQCTGNPQGYGPYDYLQRFQFSENLQLVESAHFNSKVEQLISGAKPNRALEPDLDYTLRAWPNHHRALYSVVRYRLLYGNYTREDLAPPECYLQRAIAFSPNDGTSYMIYGILLHRLDHKSDAEAKYRSALALSPNDTQIKYNLGLLLVDMSKYDQAKELAIEVYGTNYPLMGLKNKLIKKGVLAEGELQK